MRAKTGSEKLDKFLGGGYEESVVTTIYGPAASGKTQFLMLAMTQTPKDKKIIFIDTEGGFSTERLKQVCNYPEKVLERTIFLNPTNFGAQDDAIDKLKGLMKKDISLICMDTLTTLYRVEMSSEDNYELNKRLAKQLRDLVEIARTKKIPILVTAQVYADFDDPGKFNVVGGTIVKNMSKCMLELRKDETRKIRIAKHRSMPQKEIEFDIVQTGIEIHD